MDLTSAIGRIGVKQACTTSRWRYTLAQSEVEKRKECYFCLTCDYASRPGITLSYLSSTFQHTFCTGYLSPGEAYIVKVVHYQILYMTTKKLNCRSA